MMRRLAVRARWVICVGLWVACLPFCIAGGVVASVRYWLDCWPQGDE